MIIVSCLLNPICFISFLNSQNQFVTDMEGIHCSLKVYFLSNPFFFKTLHPSVSLWLLIFLSPFSISFPMYCTTSVIWKESLVSFFGSGCILKLYFEDSGLVYTLACTHSPSRLFLSPGLPLLHFSIFLSAFSSCLLLYVIAKSLLSAPFCLLPPLLISFTHPLLSLSASLFRGCAGWSPCGTPCRVPNLFIISALCQDAQGMLKYTPPRSGYKWAGVPSSLLRAPTAQQTWPLGWTGLTS